MSDARTTTLATRLTGQAAATALAASAGAVLIVAGIIRAAVSQALFADGSNYLLQIVNTHGFFLVDGRTLGTRLLQAPAVVAVSWFNVHSYHVLSIALGLGYFVEPAVLCALALVIARRDRTVLVFAVTASTLLITLSSGLAMECTLATALFIVAATMLLVDDALSWPRIVVLALIALLAMSTYQSFVVLAPALVLLLVARHARPVPHVPVWVTIGLSLLLTAATVTSGISLSHPDPSGGRLLTCATRISCYSSTSQAHLVIATLIIAGLAVGAWFAEPLVTPSGRSGWLIAAVVVVFLLLVTTRVPIEPAVSYDNRPS